MQIRINKMKNKKYRTVRTVPKSNLKMEERDKIDTPSTYIHDCLLSGLDIGTSVKI